MFRPSKSSAITRIDILYTGIHVCLTAYPKSVRKHGLPVLEVSDDKGEQVSGHHRTDSEVVPLPSARQRGAGSSRHVTEGSIL